MEATREPGDIMDNKEIFRRYQDALRKPDTINEMVAADFVGHDLPPPSNRAALIELRVAINRAFTHEKFTIADLIAEGDRVAARTIDELTHTGEFEGIAPNGKRFTLEIFEIVRIADGKIAERWAALNPSYVEFIRQLRGQA